MKINLSNHRLAKILSLLLAIAIWFLIKNTLAGGGGLFEKPPEQPAHTQPAKKK